MGGESGVRLEDAVRRAEEAELQLLARERDLRDEMARQAAHAAQALAEEQSMAQALITAMEDAFRKARARAGNDSLRRWRPLSSRPVAFAAAADTFRPLPPERWHFCSCSNPPLYERWTRR